MSTPEIGIYSESKIIQPRDLDFFAEACNIQIRRDAAPIWNKDPWACITFDTVPEGAYPMAMKDEVPPGEEGDHGDWDGKIAGSVLVDAGTSLTLSHECLEMWGNPELNIWINNAIQELCDPCEEQTYTIEVEMFGEKRNIVVSNFLTPNYFQPGSKGPWDFLGLLPGPLTIAPGGYLTMRDDNGNISNHFPAGASHTKMAKLARKFSNPESRTYRLLTTSVKG